MSAKKILIVEDDKELSKISRDYFEASGFEVYQAYDGEEALKIIKDIEIDLITLDIMLPKLDGFEVLKIIRSSTFVPVIIVSAINDESNMLKGYNLKVDDFISKPYKPRVLVAKAINLLERVNKTNELTKYTKGALELDFEQHTIKKDNQTLELSKTEFDLLSMLIRHENQVCTRSMLLDEIWGLSSYVDDRIVDTYVKNLRKALKPYNYIKTIFKSGYMFTLENDEQED